MAEFNYQNRRDFLKYFVGTSAVLTGFPALSKEVLKSKDLSHLTILYTNDLHSRIEPFPTNDPKFAFNNTYVLQDDLITWAYLNERYTMNANLENLNSDYILKILLSSPYQFKVDKLYLETEIGSCLVNALINIGGNIIALGKHGETPWRVGIQDPRGSSAIATIDLADGWAIGTSGDYQRYFEINGKRYCHIIDPRTGYPAQGTEAVTVLLPPQKNLKAESSTGMQSSAGVLSDVLSKPIFLSTLSQRLTVLQQFAQQFQLQDVMIIDSQHRIFITPSLTKRIHWLDEKNAKQVTVLN